MSYKLVYCLYKHWLEKLGNSLEGTTEYDEAVKKAIEYSKLLHSFDDIFKRKRF